MISFLGLLNIGTPELIIVIVVAIMLFGGELPDVARKAARVMGKVRGMADDLTRELKHGEHAKALDLRDEVRDIDAAVRDAGRAPPSTDTPAGGELEPAPSELQRVAAAARGRDPFADDPDAPEGPGSRPAPATADAEAPASEHATDDATAAASDEPHDLAAHDEPADDAEPKTS